MDATLPTKHADDHGHDHGHDAHHDDHKVSFINKYIFSTDHKMIGVQYGITGLLFLALGFLLMLVMRWSIANPGLPLPASLSWIVWG
jgi:cytochrome c oxidase subunit 1